MDFIFNQDEIIDKVKERFNDLKQKYNIKYELDELDRMFFIYDLITNNRFISNNLLNMISRSIYDSFYSFLGILHGILVPNPQNLTQISESNLFNEEEKKQISNLIDNVMIVMSKRIDCLLNQDNQKFADFINESVDIFKKIQPELIKIRGKITQYWITESIKNKKQE